jgi:polyisoprenoid-binding protein YceI
MATDAKALSTATSTWKIDPLHSRVGFSVKHMLVTTVRGHFKGVSGTILLDEANPANSSVAVEIDATSVDTGVEQRDAHLRNADFLLADEHPKITFTSTHVALDGADRGKVTGDLTMRGVTLPVSLDAELTGRGKNARGAEIIGFELTGRINRRDWGVSFNAPLELGGFALGDQLKVEIDVEAIREG